MGRILPARKPVKWASDVTSRVTDLLVGPSRTLPRDRPARDSMIVVRNAARALARGARASVSQLPSNFPMPNPYDPPKANVLEPRAVRQVSRPVALAANTMFRRTPDGRIIFRPWGSRRLPSPSGLLRFYWLIVGGADAETLEPPHPKPAPNWARLGFRRRAPGEAAWRGGTLACEDDRWRSPWTVARSGC